MDLKKSHQKSKRKKILKYTLVGFGCLVALIFAIRTYNIQQRQSNALNAIQRQNRSDSYDRNRAASQAERDKQYEDQEAKLHQNSLKREQEYQQQEVQNQIDDLKQKNQDLEDCQKGYSWQC